jgi:hypothetical protein
VTSRRVTDVPKRRRRVAALGCLAAHSILCSPSIFTQYVRVGESVDKHVNSFTVTCALPVHNVAAEGTRYDPTCKAHTHVADD